MKISNVHCSFNLSNNRCNSLDSNNQMKMFKKTNTNLKLNLEENSVRYYIVFILYNVFFFMSAYVFVHLTNLK